LLIKVQKNQDLFWNQMLSWFFVQQKEYGKAFIQEKAIYKREPDSFSNIVNLAELAIEEEENEIAGEILTFILENTQDIDLHIFAQEYLMRIKINKAKKSDYAKIESEIELLLKQYGVSPYSLDLQRLQAEFLAFYQNAPEKGKLVLQKAMELPLNKFQLAEAKMELADILLYEEKFNQALLYYSQIEEDLKNDVLGHEASLKAAKTSYFKADFDWALTQLKVLKSASTQLIANDALELFLLINDNTVADSTRTALKKFSKGDFYLYQNKNQEALTQFQHILKDHKGEEIEDEAILRIGQTYQELTDYNNALSFYQQIIDNHPESIYRDEALFFSEEIYNKYLNQPEKAKPLYEAVLFNHQDSIHFVEARKNFRQLRGDSNL
jgi:tetratricopeptide (TPR) repeat protein